MTAFLFKNQRPALHVNTKDEGGSIYTSATRKRQVVLHCGEQAESVTRHEYTASGK